VLAREDGGAGLHLLYRVLEHGHDRRGGGGVAAVPVEDRPAVGQLHQLLGQRPKSAPARPPSRAAWPGSATTTARPSRPGGPGDQHMVPCTRTSQISPFLAAADRQRPQIHPDRDRQGRDDGGQGVAADELQHQRPGEADRIRHNMARTMARLSARAGEVGRRLARHQSDRHRSGVAGCRNLAEHGSSTGPGK